MRFGRRAAVSITSALTAAMVVNGAAGYLVFSNADDDAASRVDAVVVLGGEHDGREVYGVSLAQHGIASTVVLSNPYSDADPLMRRMCLHRNGAIEVLCVRPEPSSTRGEAILTRRLAKERNWKKILVVTWRYHLPRAGLVFRQCLSDLDGIVTVKAVPRQYILPVWYWQYLYLYQATGIGEALLSDRC